MNRFLRIPALVTLVALLFSMASSASAASCHVAKGQAGHSQSGHSHSPKTPSQPSAPECPMLSGASCGVTVSLPAVAEGVVVLSPKYNQLATSSLHVPPAPAVTAIFHPPR
jgi:hypothetical protein